MLSADALAQQIDGLVHLDTQRAADGIDLTVNAVYRTTGSGQLDFGGGEFESVPRESIPPTLADPDDDYGWWRLEEGAYIVEYNEALTLTEAQRAQVSPLKRTLSAGAHHATFGLTEGRAPMETLLVVSRMGCDLKENCRLSRLTVYEDVA